MHYSSHTMGAGIAYSVFLRKKYEVNHGFESI